MRLDFEKILRQNFYFVVNNRDFKFNMEGNRIDTRTQYKPHYIILNNVVYKI